MSKLTQVLQWLIEGKKVRRIRWTKDFFIELKNDSFLTPDGSKANSCDLDFDGEWEIFTHPEIHKLIDGQLYVVWMSKSEVDLGYWSKSSNEFILYEPHIGSRTTWKSYKLEEVEWAELPTKRSSVRKNG